MGVCHNECVLLCSEPLLSLKWTQMLLSEDLVNYQNDLTTFKVCCGISPLFQMNRQQWFILHQGAEPCSAPPLDDVNQVKNKTKHNLTLLCNWLKKKILVRRHTWIFSFPFPPSRITSDFSLGESSFILCNTLYCVSKCSQSQSDCFSYSSQLVKNLQMYPKKIRFVPIQQFTEPLWLEYCMVDYETTCRFV